MKTSLRLFSAVCTLALLGGCASDGGLKPSARIGSAASLAAGRALAGVAVSPAAWPARDWYGRYGDAQLDALIEEAVAGNPGVKIADARVRQAAGLEAMANARLAPQFSGGARSSRQLFSANSNIPKPLAGSWAWSNDASLNLSYEVDFWGKNRAGLDAAIGRQHAVEVEAQAARLMLAVAITQTYVRLSTSWAQHDLAEAIVLQREHVLRLTSERVDAHIDAMSDMRQAETALSLAKGELAAIGEAMTLLRYQLAALVGAGPDRGDRLQRPAMHAVAAPGVPTVLPSELIARRPDVVAQRWRVEAAAQDIKVAQTQFLPSINLAALIGLQSLGFDRLLAAGSRVTGASGALGLPIFDGGRLRGNLAARDAEYDLAVEQYQLTLVDAVRDVVSQLASIKALAERAGLQAQARQSAEQAYDLSLQRYKAGVGNYLQVLATQAQLLNLSRASIDFDARAYELDIGLVRALGGGYQAASERLPTNSISAR